MKVLVACEYSGRVRDVEIDAKEIEGFPGYIVTSSGEVYGSRTNVGFRGYFRKLRPSRDAKGYLGLTICGRKKSKKRVHRLVAQAFHPNPDGKPCVRHLDGNPENNHANNLAWGTYSENEQDKHQHGTYDLRRVGKLSDAQRALAFELSGSGVPQKMIADVLSVSRPTITRLLNGSTWGRNA